MPVPRTVDDHFLSYINPQEASALRAMGGGITASGGQRMMNGIPSFRPSDNAAEANATNNDETDDPHGVGQPTSASPFGGVPGVDQATSEHDARARANVREREREAKPRSLQETLDRVSFMAQVEREQRELDRAREKEARERARQARENPFQGVSYSIGLFPGVSIPVENPFSGLSIPGEPAPETEVDETIGKKKGGEVKVPEKVSGHFLAYINPQEAAMLRGAGGGITALGGQKMRNGIPIFDNPQDDEGQGGAPPTDTAAAAAGNQPGGGPGNSPGANASQAPGIATEDPEEVAYGQKGIVGTFAQEFGRDPFGTMADMNKAGVSFTDVGLSGLGISPNSMLSKGINALATGISLAQSFVNPGKAISGLVAAGNIPDIAEDFGFDVDENTDEVASPDTGD